ncbi:MAG: class I SAM-dependent methyltransferase [Planctomycetota bacterium]|jgi:2-polyprenyl-3-methyl-5-hydroxy-6-metoxy-1,4-benzoquinol methylase
MNDHTIDRVSTLPDGEQRQPCAMTDVVVDANSCLCDAPSYEHAGRSMRASRSPLACKFREQILRTTEPFRATPVEELTVLDVGCGFGATSLALAEQCRSVVGIDPWARLVDDARAGAEEKGLSNVEFEQADIATWESPNRFDLVVLDNVLEHLPEQRRSLCNVVTSLKPGGVCYILVPNRLWPIEVHYKLPFLSWLPLSIANRYLRLSRRGTDYTDSSYAPTYGALRRMLNELPGIESHFVLPADLSLTTGGNSLTYRIGVGLLRQCSCLWWISKAFLVVLRKVDE